MTDRPAEPTLFDKVDGLTDELRGVRSAVNEDRDARDKQTAVLERQTAALEKQTATLDKKMTTARRSIRLSIVALVAVALLVGFKWQDDRHRAVVACKAGNRAREQSQARIEDAGSTLTDSIARVISATNPPKDPAAFDTLFAQIKADYVKNMRDNYNRSVDLRPRDC